jgi:hypothetical protein
MNLHNSQHRHRKNRISARRNSAEAAAGKIIRSFKVEFDDEMQPDISLRSRSLVFSASQLALILTGSATAEDPDVACIELVDETAGLAILFTLELSGDLVCEITQLLGSHGRTDLENEKLLRALRTFQVRIERADEMLHSGTLLYLSEHQ